MSWRRTSYTKLPFPPPIPPPLLSIQAGITRSTRSYCSSGRRYSHSRRRSKGRFSASSHRALGLLSLDSSASHLVDPAAPYQPPLGSNPPSVIAHLPQLLLTSTPFHPNTESPTLYTFTFPYSRKVPRKIQRPFLTVNRLLCLQPLTANQTPSINCQMTVSIVKLPLLLRYLEPHLCIQMAGGMLDPPPDRLPTAATCMNLLKLPPYRTLQVGCMGCDRAEGVCCGSDR